MYCRLPFSCEIKIILVRQKSYNKLSEIFVVGFRFVLRICRTVSCTACVVQQIHNEWKWNEFGPLQLWRHIDCRLPALTHSLSAPPCSKMLTTSCRLRCHFV